MEKIAQLRCVACATAYPRDTEHLTCPRCGLGGVLDIEYDYEHIRERGFGPEKLKNSPHRSLWRYLDLLPLPDDVALPSLEVGFTPIYPAPRLAERLGVSRLLIKDDTRQPTASFKDRASSVAVLKARSLGVSEIACASTGNAASSLAGWSAHLGLKAYIFVPASAPEAKVVQLRIFQSKVLLVEGSYDEAWDLCQTAAGVFGWYNRNAAVNPAMVEGKKTCGLEIAEQLGEKIPDWVSVSVGDGCTIAGIWKGLCEMKRFGFIPRLPRLLATQAKGANPIERAFLAGKEDIEPQPAQTLADSISVGHPRNSRKALKALRESAGKVVSVSDEEILGAIHELASTTGVFGEPAGVAGIAGIRRAREEGIIKEGESVLHVVTGNGLKDIQSAVRAANVPVHRVKGLSDVEAVVRGS